MSLAVVESWGWRGEQTQLRSAEEVGIHHEQASQLERKQNNVLSASDQLS